MLATGMADGGEAGMGAIGGELAGLEAGDAVGELVADMMDAVGDDEFQ